MIRIKDYIFNENEIVKIQFDDGSKEMEIDHKNGNMTFIDGTLDDIEWNYEQSNIKEDEYIELSNKYQKLSNRNEELEEENEKLEEELKELKNDYSILVTGYKKLKEKIEGENK